MQIPIDDPTASLTRSQLSEDQHTAASVFVLDQMARRLALVTALMAALVPLVGIPYFASTDISNLFFITPSLLLAVGIGIYRKRLSAQVIAAAFALVMCGLVFNAVRLHGLLHPMVVLLVIALGALALLTTRRSTIIGGILMFGTAFFMTLSLRLDQVGGELFSLTMAHVAELITWLALGGFNTWIAVYVLSALVYELEISNIAERREREHRWLAERGAQQSEEQMRRILDNAPVGITLLDEKGDIIGWNRVNEMFLGVSSEKMLGTAFHDFLCQVDPQHPLLVKLDELYRGRPFFNLVFDVASRRGVAHFMMSGKPIFDEAGRVCGAVTVGADITNVIRGVNDVRQERHSEEVAQLAHDIRSPLMALGLSVEVLQMLLENEQPDLERIRAKLPIIQQQQEHAAEVVEGYYSTLNNRDTPQVSLSPGSLAEMAATVLRASFQSQDIALEVDSTLAEGEAVSTHSVLVRQILINLLANARDAVLAIAERSDIQGWVRLVVEPSGDQIIYSVSDNGGGRLPIDPEVLFNRGFTTKPVGEGTGMGLFIGRATAQHIGGSLDVIQGEHGLIFQLSLPRIDPHASEHF